MGLPVIATALSGIGAGAAVYSGVQQSRSEQAAAEFNAEQTRNAAKVKSDDARENALRRQEEHRKYLAAVKATMLEKGPAIEGGDAEFLEEATGNLQLQILDEAARVNREQASLANQAFRFDQQADQIEAARPIQTASTAIQGFNNVYRTGQRAGYWGQPRANVNALR